MAKKPKGPETAQSMASKQREISVSEFFTKNRHLLGFDNPRKALLTCVKEAVDNALDACEGPTSFPRSSSRSARSGTEDRFVVVVEDNGPGIVKEQIKKVFEAPLRVQVPPPEDEPRPAGIGIAAAGMYGLITTGKP